MSAENTRACLLEYLSASGGNYKEVVDFFGFKRKTIRSWVSGQFMPKGFALLKLRYFLMSKGYYVAELENLETPIKKLGALIAFGKIDLDYAHRAIGLDRVDRLVSLLLGKIKTSAERMRVVELLSSEREVLDSSAADIIAVEEPGDKETIPLLRALKLISGLLNPRLDALLSDNVPAEQRRQFRDTATGALIFDLANEFDICVFRLNALCSEETRKRHLSELNRIRLAERRNRE